MLADHRRNLGERKKGSGVNSLSFSPSRGTMASSRPFAKQRGCNHADAMPRRARSIQGGYVYHVLNRANGHARLFLDAEDYDAFERVMQEAFARQPLRILGYCLMPNHWHMVVWPEDGQDRQVSEFLRWLTVTHTQRWHAHHQSAGSGHLYQGRFKSFPVESDDHLYTVLRYVERNPVRGNLVKRAQDWRWSSLDRSGKGGAVSRQFLANWPIPRPRDWTSRVNRADGKKELEALRRSIQRGQPFGSEEWSQQIVTELGLESTVRPRGARTRLRLSPENDSRPLFHDPFFNDLFIRPGLRPDRTGCRPGPPPGIFA